MSEIILRKYHISKILDNTSFLVSTIDEIVYNLKKCERKVSPVNNMFTNYIIDNKVYFSCGMSDFFVREWFIEEFLSYYTYYDIRQLMYYLIRKHLNTSEFDSNNIHFYNQDEYDNISDDVQRGIIYTILADKF